jgi:hypothetical protein
MKVLFFLLLLASIVFTQSKDFTPEYFVKKHNLKLPEVTEKNIDVSKHTHKSDSWFYFYNAKSDTIDSVYDYLNIERFPPNKQYDKYTYRGDSTIIKRVAISQRSFDTTTNLKIIFTDNYCSKTYFDNKNGCYTFVKFTPWGERKSEKNLCPGEKEPEGQEFAFVNKGNFIECIETYKGKVDSNNIRHYYFSSFDSLVADYMVEKDNPPFLAHLLFYTTQHKRKLDYGFDLFKHYNEVINFNYDTYRPDGKLFRTYYFDINDRNQKEKEYLLINYSEYTYDSLGRKTTMITYVIPDKKEAERK